MTPWRAPQRTLRHEEADVEWNRIVTAESRLVAFVRAANAVANLPVNDDGSCTVPPDYLDDLRSTRDAFIRG